MRLLVPASLAVVLTLSMAAPGLASAQEPAPAADADTARADALFEEARALMASGDHAAACPKLEESQRIRPGIGTLFNLADCHEKTGQLVLAYKEFTEVAERTKVALQADREKIARERLAALEAKVPRVIVAVPDDRRDAKVAIDGQDLPATGWNVPQPLEPGDHVVTASLPDRKKPFEQRFTVAAGDAPVTITIGEEGVASGDAGGKRNTGLIVTGSILMGVGLVGAAVGSWQFQEGREGAGLATGIGGLACIGVGIPLFVIGLKKRPVEGAPAATASGADPLEAIEPGPIPAVTVGALGPGSAMAAWRF